MSAPSPTAPDRAIRAGGWHRWLVASRPRTLTMAITPVVVGASLAWAEGADANWPVFMLTLACAVLIQVGTNLLNDVTDYEKGNDRADRVGPLRITAAGWATPSEVRRAAGIVFGLAMVLGLVLVWLGGPAILGLGVFSIIAGWAYSGGSRPVSHGPYGELFVLLFFGLVAVGGSHYLQAGQWSPLVVPTGLAIGSMASAVLLLNNYRDLAADTTAGRRTLAAVIGPAQSRALYAVLMLLPLALPIWLALRNPSHPAALLAWLSAPLLLHLVRKMGHASGAALNPVLGQTALSQAAFGLLLAAGMLL